jgi:hypothetical protein
MNPVVAITGQRRMNFSSGKIMNPSGKPAIVQNTTADGTYHVPKRFGMSGMLAITTLMAIIFGVIYNMGNLINDPLYAERGTHPLIFLFMGILILIMCLVQMACGDVPRVASITTGVILLPLFVAFAMLYLSGWKAFGRCIGRLLRRCNYCRLLSCYRYFRIEISTTYATHNTSSQFCSLGLGN